MSSQRCGIWWRVADAYLHDAIRPWLERMGFTVAIHPNPRQGFGPILVAERLEERGSLCVWLAHISRVNNSPMLPRRSVHQRITSQTRGPFTLEVSLRDQASLSWSPGRQAVQLAML